MVEEEVKKDVDESISKEDLDDLKIVADYYYKNYVAIHVSLKKKDKWYNGYIREFISEGFILDEFKKGTTLIFWKDLYNDGIEEYINPEDAKKMGGITKEDGERKINTSDKKAVCESE